MSVRMPRARIVGVGIAVALIGLVALLAVLVLGGGGGGTDPGRLRVGDCFDVPTATDRIGDLRRRGCNGPHGAEVFHVYVASAAASTGYPTDVDWETLIYPVCDPAFDAYTGTPVGDRLDIGYRYLVPTADRWASGDRRVTCFITSADGSPLSRSFRLAP